jgi:hypothetical protein
LVLFGLICVNPDFSTSYDGKNKKISFRLNSRPRLCATPTRTPAPWFSRSSREV